MHFFDLRPLSFSPSSGLASTTTSRSSHSHLMLFLIFVDNSSSTPARVTILLFGLVVQLRAFEYTERIFRPFFLSANSTHAINFTFHTSQILTQLDYNVNLLPLHKLASSGTHPLITRSTVCFLLFLRLWPQRKSTLTGISHCHKPATNVITTATLSLSQNFKVLI